MTVSAFGLLFLAVLGLLALAAAGLGIRLLLGNRKPLRRCACAFDANREGVPPRRSDDCRACERSRPIS
jgi:hypothetical protein